MRASDGEPRRGHCGRVERTFRIERLQAADSVQCPQVSAAVPQKASTRYNKGFRNTSCTAKIRHTLD